MFLQIVFVLGCILKDIFCQLPGSPQFALSPEQACSAYPGYKPVTLSWREQSQLLPLGLTQYKVQKQQECSRSIFIRYESIPQQLVVGVCQDSAESRNLRVLYNVTGRCQTENRFTGFRNQLLDASITREGPAARFVDEVTLEQVTSGILIKENVAQNTTFCDDSQGFYSIPYTDISLLLPLATTEYKVGLQQDNICPVGVLIYQEQVPEKLVVDVCVNRFDETLYQTIFDVTSFCIQNGSFESGRGVVRNDVFQAIISTLPTGILQGSFFIMNSTTPSDPPLFGGMTVEGGK